jgi:hypothetical protein
VVAAADRRRHSALPGEPGQAPSVAKDMENRIRQARPHVTRNEDLIFELSSPGKSGVELPPLDVPAVCAEELLGKGLHRADV